TARAHRMPISAIAISVPGISRANGTVWAPNIPGWENYPLRREIQAALRGAEAAASKVIIASDREGWLLGGAWRGARQGARNGIFLAVGTGIGAGIMVDGKILRGANDIAGAVGWMALQRPLRREYVQCGCFEFYGSGNGIAKNANAMRG